MNGWDTIWLVNFKEARNVRGTNRTYDNIILFATFMLQISKI